MADDFSIKIQALIDEQKSLSNIQTSLDNLSKKINITFDVDNTSLNKINKEVELIQKSLGGKKLQIVDYEEAKKAGYEFEKFDKTLDNIRKKYEQIGQVNFTSKKFDPVTKDLTSFIAKVEQADGVIKEFKYDLVNLNKDNQITQAFQLNGLKEIDNTARIREQQLQVEHKINTQLIKDAQEYADWWSKALNDRDASNRQRISSLGSKKSDVSSSVFSGDYDKQNKALQEYVREVYKAQGATSDLDHTQVSLSRQFDKAGNEIYKYNIAIKDGKGYATQYAGTIDKLSAALYENSRKTRDATTRSLGLVEQFKIAASRVPVWLGATTLYFGTLHTLQSIVSTIIEVDTKMTELKRVMDSSTNFNQFLKDSIGLSNELSRNLNDVLDISNEFARQGYSATETLDLTRVAGMLQNISDLSSQESLDAIISAMKNYNIEASKSITIADKLNEVDNNYSVSTQQLATSMFKAASTAKAYGVTLDELIGQTTSVAEITRESGNVVGNFLKTLYSRLMTSNQSVNALHDIGVEVKNSNGDMKTATEVLGELHDKWDTLSKSQQQSLGVTIAGQRQLSRFYALMSNYGDSVSAANTALNSQNSAVRENAKYQDSLQARITRLNTAWKELALEVGNAVVNDSLINVVHTLTELASVAAEAVDKFGVLPYVFGAVAASVVLLSSRIRGLVVDMIFAKNAERSLIISTEALSTAFKGLVASTLVGAVFAAIGFAVEKLIEHYGKLRQEQEKQKQQTQELIDSYKANKDQISELADEYESMSAKVSTGELAKTDKEYLDVQTKLGNVLPTTIEYIDKSGQAHLKTTDAINKEISSLKELSKLDSEKFIEGFSDKLDEINKKIITASTSISKYNLEASTSAGSFNASGSNPVQFKQTPLTADDKTNNIIAEREMQAQIKNRVDLFKQLSVEYQNFLGVQDDLTQADKTYINTLIENSKEQLATEKGQKKLQTQVKSLIGSYGELRKAFGSGVDFSHIFEGLSSDKIGILSSLVTGYKDGGETVQQFTKLLEQNGFTTEQVIAVTNALTDAKKENTSATDAQSQAQDTLNQILSGSLSVEDALAQATLGYTKQQIDENNKLIEIYAGLSKAKNLDANQSALLAQVYDELKSRFPDLVKGHEVSVNALYGEANAQSVLYQAVVASANGQLDAEHQKTLGMALELQNQKKIVEQQIKLYQRGLDAYVASQMAQNNGRLAMNGAMMDNYRRIQQMQAQVDNVYVPKIQKAAVKLGKYLNVSTPFKTPSWDYGSSSGGSGKKGSSGSSGSSSTPVEQYQTDKFSQALAKLEAQLKKVQATQNDYSDKTSKGYINALKSQISLIKQEESLTQKQIKTLESQTAALKRQRDHMGSFSHLSNEQKQKWNDLSQAIDDNVSKINDLNGQLVSYGENVQDLQDQIKQVYSDTADEVIDTMKSMYEQQKQMALDANQAEMDALDEKMKKYQDAAQQQLDAIDRQENASTYNNDLADKQKEIADLQAQYDKLSLDNSVEGKKRKEDIAKQLADKQKELADFQHQHEVELRKQNIQDDLDAKQKETDQQKDALDKKRDEIEKYYEDIANDDRKWADIRTQIMQGHFDAVTKQLEAFKKLFKDHMKDLGNSVTNNLLDKIDALEDKLKNLSGQGGSPTNNPPKSSGGGNSSSQKPDTKGTGGHEDSKSNLPLRKRSGGFATPHGGWNSSSVVDYMKSHGYYATFDDRENLYKYLHGGSYSGTQSQNDWLLKKLKIIGLRTGGFTGSNEGLAYLHDYEQVLNQDDTKNVFKSVKLADELVKYIMPRRPDLFDNPYIMNNWIHKPTEPQIHPRKPGIGDVTINAPITIENMNGTKQDAEMVFDIFTNKVANEMHKKGRW